MYYKKEYDRLKECALMNVPITKQDRIKFKDIYNENPRMFRANVTREYYNIMVNWVFDGKVWKEAIMGTTRHGKSEVAQTKAMLYIDVFNEALKQGVFEKLKEQGIFYKMEKLKRLSVNQILPSQSNQLYELREKQKKNELILGYPRIVDEDKTNIGGLGSMSEKIELDNINNITAQTLQADWQLRPDRFVLKNTVYGLFQEKMDRKNKVNWSMLYEIRNDPNSNNLYNFIGWVATPLHYDEELRKKYNEKKKENILKIIDGTDDLRLLERLKVARLISKDELFKQRSKNGAVFKLSKYQQECILNEWIIEKKIQNFNEMEKQEIIEHARMIAEKEYLQTKGVGA